MSELQTLIELLSKLPNGAMWALVLIFLYKTIVIGSIYGVIRLAITSFIGHLNKRVEAQRTQDVVVKNMTINSDVYDELVLLLREVKGGGAYLHSRSVQDLRKAWRGQEGGK